MTDEQWARMAEVIVSTCKTRPRYLAVPQVRSMLTRMASELVDLADREARVVVDGMNTLSAHLNRIARTTGPVLPVIAALVVLEDAVRADLYPTAHVVHAIAALDEARGHAA